MSWNEYISAMLLNKGHVDEAAILSAGDAAVWASTPEFVPRGYAHTLVLDNGASESVNVNEASELVALFNNGGRPVNKTGLRYNNQKYQVLRYFEDVGVIYAKKEKGGACIAKSNQAIIFATWSEDKKQTPGNCNKAVEDLATYLKNSGF
eukprot:GILI01000230.1.p1 GENE.GILI01000230.1~~GILI01000230.1.p1  ORF type:complete len:150 (+),score=53.43 GILI01000230.1:49-498(+)